MDNFVDFLMNRVVMGITKIRESAASYNGECTWHFSQCKDPVRGVMRQATNSSGGICDILAARWICEKYNLGDMKTWLAGADGHRGNIDLAKLSLLCQSFAAARATGNQEDEMEAYMKAKGVVPRPGVSMGGYAAAANKFDVRAHLLGDLKKRILRDQKYPLYAHLTVAEDNRWLGSKAHAMALKVMPINGGGFQYFDPNYGEFSFGRWNNFRDWFLYYYTESGYQKYMGRYYNFKYF
jgi:YopT peptidase